MELAKSYQCLLTDEIRRQSTMYFQRRQPNGTVERATVAALSPLRIQVQNKQGYWLIGEGEAIKVEYDVPRSTVLGEILQLVIKVSDEVTLSFGEDEVVAGVSCNVIIATLSDALTAKLAREFREDHKHDRLFRGNPKIDTLQFVAKRRIYSLGKTDSLLYRYKTYDGNGDLLSDRTASNQSIGSNVENAVFEIPEGWPVFVARSSEQLAQHVGAKSKESQRAFWGNLQKQIAAAGTNNPTAAVPTGGSLTNNMTYEPRTHL